MTDQLLWPQALSLLAPGIFHHAARALDTFSQLNARNAAGNLHHAAGDCVAFFMLGNIFVKTGWDHLLDAEADGALCSVQIEHLRFHRLADLEHVLGMIDAFFGADFADVDHAFNAFSNLHECAELGDAGDRAFNHRADGQIFAHSTHGSPSACFSPSEMRRSGDVHAEDDGFHGFAGFEHVTGLANFFRPRHFRNVDQAFNAGLKLHERAKIHEPRDGAAHALAGFVLFRGCIPWMRQKLLHAERDAPLVGINFEHANFNFLADRKHISGLVDAAPGDVRNMQQAVNAADIHERAVIGQAADGAAHGLAYLNLSVAPLFGERDLLLQKSRGDRPPRLLP